MSNKVQEREEEEEDKESASRNKTIKSSFSFSVFFEVRWVSNWRQMRLQEINRCKAYAASRCPEYATDTEFQHGYAMYNYLNITGADEEASFFLGATGHESAFHCRRDHYGREDIFQTVAAGSFGVAGTGF